MTLYVGTSGWAYREWQPDFYPASIAQSRYLEHLSRRLGACEINATFYAMQPRTTFERWAESTPAEFRFTVKLHRALTHARASPPDARRSFVGEHMDAVAPLGRRLGALLWQIHPRTRRDTDVLGDVLDLLPSEVPTAIELGDPSWDSEDVDARIAAAGAARVVADASGPPPARLPPGPLGYVRLRADRYSARQRAAWLDLLAREARDRDVYVFAKHRGGPARDPLSGIGLAQWLVRNAPRASSCA